MPTKEGFLFPSEMGELQNLDTTQVDAILSRKQPKAGNALGFLFDPQTQADQQGLLAAAGRLVSPPSGGETLIQSLVGGANVGIATKSSADLKFQLKNLEEAKLRLDQAKSQQAADVNVFKAKTGRGNAITAAAGVDVQREGLDIKRQDLTLRRKTLDQNIKEFTLGGTAKSGFFRTADGQEVATTLRADESGKIFGVNPETGLEEPNKGQFFLATSSTSTTNVGQTAESAGRTALVQSGITALSGYMDGLVDANGVWDNKELAKANIDLTPGSGKGIPFTSGGGRASQFSTAIEAVLRLETGAAAPDSEIVRLLDRFQPTLLDTDTVKSIKVKLVANFLKNSLNLIDAKDRDGSLDKQRLVAAAMVRQLDEAIRGAGKTDLTPAPGSSTAGGATDSITSQDVDSLTEEQIDALLLQMSQGQGG